MGARLTETAPSSGYGKVTASVSPRREAERPSFKPQLAGSKTGERLRQSARSSAYGKEAVQVRPKTAPAGDGKTFTTPYGEARLEYTSRHTLLLDKPDKPERAPSPVFNLDCVAIHKQRRGSLGGMGPLSADVMGPKLEPTEQAVRMKSTVASSGYGVNAVEAKPREDPTHKPHAFASPFRDIDTSADWSTRKGALHEHEPINVGTITPMGKSAASSGYGTTTPPTVERPATASEPVWSPVGKNIKAEMPPAPRNKLTQQVGTIK